jgi:nucleoside-diphosphate-sugar epimerase
MLSRSATQEDPLRVLLIGGTGLISVGIVKHLLARGASVAMFNRGKRPNTLDASIEQITGDRNESGALARIAQRERFDAVIDMICFSPDQARATISAFAGRCEQVIFCSTVCAYGVKVPPGVVVDESFPREPISDYGRNKKTCEDLFLDAHARGDFYATIIRPSCTYGEGSPLIDQLDFDSIAWDRIERGLPVVIADGGMGLWNATHRDDCGKAFAYACQNRRTYGQCYNATTQRVFTWRDYHREAGVALGKPAQLLSLAADAIVKTDPKRFGLLREITRFHGAYTSAKAMRDIPEFRCEVDFVAGAKRTLVDLKRRAAWRDGTGDATYEKLVEMARSTGVEPVEA